MHDQTVFCHRSKPEWRKLPWRMTWRPRPCELTRPCDCGRHRTKPRRNVVFLGWGDFFDFKRWRLTNGHWHLRRLVTSWDLQGLTASSFYPASFDLSLRFCLAVLLCEAASSTHLPFGPRLGVSRLAKVGRVHRQLARGARVGTLSRRIFVTVPFLGQRHLARTAELALRLVLHWVLLWLRHVRRRLVSGRGRVLLLTLMLA